MSQVEGVVASPGFAFAPALIVSSYEPALPDPSIMASSLPTQPQATHEYPRLMIARDHAAVHIDSLRHQLQRLTSQERASLFEKHRLLLYDAGFVSRIEKEIERGPHPAEVALCRAIKIYQGFVQSTDHASFQMKMLDLLDVWGQVLSILRTGAPIPTIDIDEDCVVVAEELYPSQVAQFPPHHVKGLLTKGGGKEGSVTALTRLFDIPYFCQVKGLSSIHPGEPLILDGMAGMILQAPSPAVIASYAELAAQWEQKTNRRALLSRAQPTSTRCGHQIQLSLQLQRREHLEAFMSHGGESIGELNTAALFAEKNAIPQEDEQAELYSRLNKQLAPHPITYRLLDLNQANELPEIPMPDEPNPLLGWRGMRVTQALRPLLQRQLRALFRAATDQPLRLLLPTVSTQEELLDIQHIAGEVWEAFQAQEPQATLGIEWGLLLDTPGQLWLLDAFAPHVDFLWVDSDRMLQLVLGADQQNPRVAYLLNPIQPAMLRLMQALACEARQRNVPLGVMGKMAADTHALPYLLGMGHRRFCVLPEHFQRQKAAIKELTIERVEALIQEAQECHQLGQTMALVQQLSHTTPTDDTDTSERDPGLSDVLDDQEEGLITPFVSDAPTAKEAKETNETDATKEMPFPYED